MIRQCACLSPLAHHGMLSSPRTSARLRTDLAEEAHCRTFIPVCNLMAHAWLQEHMGQEPSGSSWEL